jgi:hypothetical protein
MDQLLYPEDWPKHSKPKNVAYFCSAQPMSEYPPASEHNFLAEYTQQAKNNATSYPITVIIYSQTLPHKANSIGLF